MLVPYYSPSHESCNLLCKFQGYEMASETEKDSPGSVFQGQVTALVSFQRTESPNSRGSFLQCRSLIRHLLHDILDLDMHQLNSRVKWVTPLRNLLCLQFASSSVCAKSRGKGDLLFHFSHLFANHVGLRTSKIQLCFLCKFI